jgi:formiminotetrahydrofolate cyclodeaminase
VPVETARRAFEVLKLVRELADIGNPNAISDVAVAAQLAATAIKGAYYNVRINLNSLSDGERAAQLEQQVTGLIDEARSIAGEVEAKI